MSLNLPAIELLADVGPATFLARLHGAGAEIALPKDTPIGLAIGLGGLGISLTDLARLYAGFARGGEAPAADRAARRSAAGDRRHGSTAMMPAEQSRAPIERGETRGDGALPGSRRPGNADAARAAQLVVQGAEECFEPRAMVLDDAHGARERRRAARIEVGEERAVRFARRGRCRHW